MQALPLLLLNLGLLAGQALERSPQADVASLREMLRDHQQPRGQGHAALLLVQSTDPEAEGVVREGLRNFEEVEAFLALAAAVRTTQDVRFGADVLAGLVAKRPAIRQAAAEAVAALPMPDLIKRLQAIAADETAEPATRQTALWVLGRCGRKAAVPVLLEHLSAATEALRRASAEALTDLTGQDLGLETSRWQAWWQRHRDLSTVQWLERRLAFQNARAHRLQGDLEQLRVQSLRLHQQLFARLPVADKLAQLQTIADQHDPAVRALAVALALEVLPGVDPARQHGLAEVLLRLSHDSNLEVQRAAVLALGRFPEATVFDRLERLSLCNRPAVRAAAARSLAAQARGTNADAVARQHKVVPLLQKALNDPALEVVMEAAEDLGALGAQEAGPVLTALLRHPAEHVRQTAAQALERVAQPAVIDGLLAALDDPGVTVRFSMVGALGRAVGTGMSVEEVQRSRVLNRLETLLLKDSDPGVRSRAATVLGECASPAILPTLWKCVLAGEDARVQEKAWAALMEVLARAGNVQVLLDWDRTIRTAGQGQRRVQLLTELSARWQKDPERRAQAFAAQEALLVAHLDQGKWAAAFPLVREALARTGNEAEINQRLQWLLTAGEQALKEGSHADALRAVEEAQPYLSNGGSLAGAFEKLEKMAGEKE